MAEDKDVVDMMDIGITEEMKDNLCFLLKKNRIEQEMFESFGDEISARTVKERNEGIRETLNDLGYDVHEWTDPSGEVEFSIYEMD